jgi:hypothetical protein
MTDKLITPPAAEPVTADELRSWLRDVSDPDAALNELIAAARETFERETSLALMPQGRRLMLDAWPVDHAAMGDWDGVREGAFVQGAPRALELPVAPLISVTAITLYAGNNAATVLSPSTYYVDTHNEPGRITIGAGVTVPAPGRSANGIQIDYQAGFADAAHVPAPIKLALKQLAAHFYENREAVADMTMSNAPQTFVAAVRRYRILPGV